MENRDICKDAQKERKLTMKKSILRICFKPLTLMNQVIRKDEKLIFFYSNLGFRDNVKAFYDYLIANQYNKKYKIVVSANDYERFAQDAPDNVTFLNNKQGIKFFMKAKYAFYCFGKYPIKPSKRQTVVNLWHGTPLKKIGHLEQGCEHIDYNYFTRVLTSAEMYKPIMAKIFGCSEKQVEVLGNPRNDEMFQPDKLRDAAIRGENNKVILWLPTYREYDDEFVISTLKMEDLQQLNEYLKEMNCKMIIKLHPLQTVDIKNMEFSKIDFISQEELNQKQMTVYTLLRNADGLITDYSSVYFDYLLLDRPIAFAVGDMEQYRDKRGFIFENPKDYMPGMEIKTREDVENFISDIINHRDDYKEERKKVNNIMNYYKDGSSSQRIAKRFISK